MWWSSNGSSHKSIEERINKARGAFFAHGQLGSFHGQLNPLSSRSLIESCVIPVLMYGSEFWRLNTTLLSRLESFHAELGKRSSPAIAKNHSKQHPFDNSGLAIDEMPLSLCKAVLLASSLLQRYNLRHIEGRGVKSLSYSGIRPRQAMPPPRAPLLH